MSGNAVEIKQIIDHIRNGKKEGFNLLYTKYAAALYGIIFRIVGDRPIAENLLEVTFVNIFKHIHEYNKANSFFTWMIQIAQGAAYDHMGNGVKPKFSDEMEMILFGKYSYNETAREMNVTEDVISAKVRNKLKAFR